MTSKSPLIEQKITTSNQQHQNSTAQTVPRMKGNRNTRRRIDFGESTSSTTIDNRNSFSQPAFTSARPAPSSYTFSTSPGHSMHSNFNFSPTSSSPRSLADYSPSGSHWAGGAYQNSPDPSNIPMPTFFAQPGSYSPPSSPVSSPIRLASASVSSPIHLDKASHDLRRLLNIQAVMA